MREKTRPRFFSHLTLQYRLDSHHHWRSFSTPRACPRTVRWVFILLILELVLEQFRLGLLADTVLEQVGIS